MYIKSLKKLSAIVFTVVVFCCFFILCSCGNKTDSPTEVTTNNTIEPTTVSEATDSNDAIENNNDAAFKAGKYLVNIDKKIICAKDDGLYYKESLESEGKKLSNEKNVYTIMSDGETVFYGEGYDIANSNQRNTPKKVYKTTISKNTSELLFESDGYIELIGIRNNCIYYLDKNESNQSAVMKFNISDNSKSKLTKDWNGQINFSCVLGNKLYAYFKNSDNSKGTFRAYDLTTEESEDIYSGMMAYSIFHDENRVVFDTFSILENSGNKKDNHVTYTVEKDGTVKKSPVITEDCSFEYATSDGKYGLYFSTPSSGKFDLYTIDLESGEMFTSENDAASCIGKNYFVTSDLLHPENIYFMYSLRLYDMNTKTAKKLSHEEYEINITKPMWIIDGCVVDWNLNTYQIYGEQEETVEENAEETVEENQVSKTSDDNSFSYSEGVFSSDTSPVILTIDEISNGKVVMHGQQGSQNRAYFPHAEGYLYDGNKMDFETVDSWGSHYTGHLELNEDSVDLSMTLTKKSVYAENTIECDITLFKE